MNGALIAIVGFLVALTALGAWYARQVRTAEDFALASARFLQVIARGGDAEDWCGAGVALHAKPAVAAQAQIRINYGDLTALLYLQGFADEDFVTP